MSWCLVQNAISIVVSIETHIYVARSRSHSTHSMQSYRARFWLSIDEGIAISLQSNGIERATMMAVMLKPPFSLNSDHWHRHLLCSFIDILKDKKTL